MKIYSSHYLSFFCADGTFILFAEYFRIGARHKRDGATCCQARPDAESDNVTAADGAFSPTISVFIIFACFQYDGAFLLPERRIFASMLTALSN